MAAFAYKPDIRSAHFSYPIRLRVGRRDPEQEKKGGIECLDWNTDIRLPKLNRPVKSERVSRIPVIYEAYVGSGIGSEDNASEIDDGLDEVEVKEEDDDDDVEEDREEEIDITDGDAAFKEEMKTRHSDFVIIGDYESWKKEYEEGIKSRK
jgi:hypothetical protein